MQHLEVSCAVRPLKWSLGVKWLNITITTFWCRRTQYAHITLRFVVQIFSILSWFFFFGWEKCLHYGNHAFEAVFARVSKTSATKFYFVQWIRVLFMCGLTWFDMQKKSLFIVVKWTTSINQFYYQQIALIRLCMRLLQHVSVIYFSHLQGALIYKGYISCMYIVCVYYCSLKMPTKYSRNI